MTIQPNNTVNAALGHRTLETESISFAIAGMTCASCVARVEKSLNKVRGVISVGVNLASERADISYDARNAGPDVFVTAVRRTGFSVPVETVTLDVTGMTCATCVGRVEKVLGRLPGAASVQVNLATEQAIIHAFRSDFSPPRTPKRERTQRTSARHLLMAVAAMPPSQFD